MNRHLWTKVIPALLLALILAAGSVLLPEEPAAKAEDWPGATDATDVNGNPVKLIPIDNTIQTWVLVGVFGGDDEALKLIGFTPEDGEEEEKGGVIEDNSKKRRKLRRKKKKDTKTIPLIWGTPPLKPVYIQDNRGSGR